MRAQAYGLLSRLYLHGVTAREVPLLREVPDLAEYLALPHDPEGSAVEHQRLFEREVLPYGSVFLEADGNLGGDVTAALGRRFAAVGMPVPESEPPDHLGQELALLAELASREDESPPGPGASDEPDAEERTALGLLDGHLLWWLPALLPAVQRHGLSFWSAVADLTLELALDHRRALVGDSPPEAPPPWNLRGAPRDPLDDPTVDLREVATFLTLPVRSGLYLSEADARALGRSRRLPGGFGTRARVLETVFHSAVAYDGMDDVIHGFRTILTGVRVAMEAMVSGPGLPRAFVDPWLRRLEGTDSLLARMARGEGPVA